MPSLVVDLVIALAAAALPAAYAWWSGQGLLHAVDDPLLPELLQARDRRVLQVGVLAFGLLAVVAAPMMAWAWPLALVLLALAVRPLRRALFDERVGAPAYVEHVVRGALATLGFWVLLAATPGIVLALPERWRLAGAGVLVVVLAAWQMAGVPLWLALNAAAPLDRRDVEPLLRDVAVRATAPMPRLVKVGTPGVHLVNAWALPTTGVPTVAFSRTLLEAFPADEVAAVFAHEMAHLEHHTPRKVRAGRVAAVVLALLSAAVPFVMPAWLALAFPVLLVVALALRAHRSRRDETASDARAVALLDGDGELLVRALVRLHALARLPRRIEREVEAASTHPSLARRVQAIREAAAAHAGVVAPVPDLPAFAAVATDGTTNGNGAHRLAEPPSLARRAAAMPLPVLLQSPAERVVVALGPERLYWFDDVPEDVRLDIESLREAAGSYRALRYPDVTELRVAPAGGERQLVVRERAGGLRRLTLHPGDVALAQRALDLVDGQLGAPVADHAPTLARLLTLAVVLLAPLGAPLAIPVWIASALALWWPARPALAALGAAAMVDALVAWWGRPLPLEDTLPLSAELALGALAIALALQGAAAREAEHAPERGRRLAGVWGVLAVLGVAGLVAAARAVPAAEWVATVAGTRIAGATAVAAAALGGWLLALAATRRLATRPRLLAAGGAVALAASAGVAGVLVAHAGGMAEVAWRDVTGTVAARHAVGENVFRVEVSPSGTRWAVQKGVARGAPVSDVMMDGYDWELGSFAEGRTRTVRALQLAFLDDARVVAVVRRGDSMEVRLEPAFAGEDPLPRRAAPLPALLQPVLRVDRETGRWFVAGRPRPAVTVRSSTTGALGGTFEDEDDASGTELSEVRHAFGARPDTLLLASGRVGSDSTTVRRWVLPRLGMATLPLADGGALYWEMPRVDGRASWLPMLLLGDPTRGALWRLGPDGARTRLATSSMVACGASGGRGALCVERGIGAPRGLVIDARGRIAARLALPADVGPATRPQGMELAMASYVRPVVSLLDAGALRGRHVLLGERQAMLDVVPTPQGFVGLAATGGGEGFELVAWRVPR